MQDEDLLALLSADVGSAFERLALAYQHRIYAFALRLCGRAEEAEEIAQDALVRAYRALTGYPAERIAGLKLRAWLFQITLNVARNRGRRRGPAVTSLEAALDNEGWEPADDAHDGPESAILRAERSREVAAHVRALPERYQAAVILRHVEGLGYGEIALVLKQPVGTVKSNVHRGVALLREELIEQPSGVR